MEYRKDIDALRAFAVLVVLFYHADVSFFKGGYIGVDVFFVISGFLITTIISKQLAKGSFSFLRFYSRRVLRLLPVLTFVVLTTALGSYFLLTGTEFSSLGGAVQSTGTVSTNLFFLQNSQDYFHQGTLKSNPLLHLWSLAIEEQFYLLLPLTLFILFKVFRKKHAKAILTLAGLASLTYSILIISESQTESFYSIWSRSWELLAGGILGFYSNKLPALKPVTANRVYVSSMFFLLAISHFYNHNTVFPGAMALPPTLLTVLAIYSGKNITGKIKKAATHRHIIFIGMISYSLYLWHWPVFVFSGSPLLRLYSLPKPHMTLQLTLAFALSILSYRFIEQPFRKIKLSRKGNLLSLFSMAAIFAVFYNGGDQILKANSKGALIRQAFVSEDYFQQLPPANKVPYRQWQLSYSDIDDLKRGKAPVILGNKVATPSFILVGDSYASMWGYGLDKRLKAKGESAILLAREACIFLKEINRINNSACYRLNKARMAFIKKSSIKTVILASSWRLVFSKLYDFKIEGKTIKNYPFKKALQNTLDELQDKNVKLVLPHVSYDKDAIAVYIDNIKEKRKRATGRSLAQFKRLDYMQKVNHALEEITSKRNLGLIDPNKILCPANECFITVGGKILIHDRDHLNNYGSEFLSEAFFQ